MLLKSAPFQTSERLVLCFYAVKTTTSCPFDEALLRSLQEGFSLAWMLVLVFTA